jgi:hypothetical protein
VLCSNNTSAWQKEINPTYGVEFAHPDSMTSVPTPSLPADFVTGEDTQTVIIFAIPSESYAGANLSGGLFTIFVNRNITIRESCAQFGNPGPQDLPASLFVVGKVQ